MSDSTDRRKKVQSKSVRSIGAKRETLSDAVLPKIILCLSAVNFSFPRCLLAQIFCHSVSRWQDSLLNLTGSQNSMYKKTSSIATFTFHLYKMSLPFTSCTWDASSAELNARLSLCQLLQEEEHSSSCPDSNTTCTQSAAKEAYNLFTVIYSLQQREHERIQLRQSLAWVEEHASLSPSLSLSRQYFGVGYNLKAPCIPELWLAGGSANECLPCWAFSWGVWIRRHVIMLLSILLSFSLCHPFSCCSLLTTFFSLPVLL